MWIAKPLSALTLEERNQWLKAAPADLPLAQTLRWAHAASSTGARAWLIFSPDEAVGGVVLELGEPGALECINGPHLDWAAPDRAPRQLATFAMSAAKACPKFRSLKIRPRWNSHHSKVFLGHLPIPPANSFEVSTWVVPLKEKDEEQWAGFHPRLKRTLAIAKKAGAITKWITPTDQQIDNFAVKIAEFSKKKGFFAPTPQWFKEILRPSAGREEIEIGMIESHFPNHRASAEILVAIHGGTAHYLFGYENRLDGERAALSPAAWAHFHAMREAKKRGAEFYDFNGFIQNVSKDDPYAGVCKFKEQWGGNVKTFFQPEFVIE